MKSKLDQRLARANYIIVVDTETNEYQVVRNEQKPNACYKICVQTAEKISRLGVMAVITRNCGPKTFWELGAVGIKVFYSAEGTVEEILEKFKCGMLREAAKANVECERGLILYN
ncbi:NifB/NifX family molybdenum-iron cluster-binding protein [Pelotomaculum propionicicum]|uniref:Dinitrogenase iron-molybdenum cofactor biosynthesis domain-containing protein n=1 Tax=Pelotomaculum propionicicum TaxID=258475 RepID=A0A4Y7RBQ1_9FIRM|nr:NifB/NifX family molybdenum-iron cluster-binding protein [Pelotomaculum propionicicum]TEB06262.1 hypothetical protein Pmgp_03806 [Pelotomaculum propionicicum]